MDASGAGRSQVGSDVAPGALRLQLPQGVDRASMRFLLVYAKRAGALLEPPAAMRLLDNTSMVPYVRVSAISFADLDDRLDILSGTVAWADPSDSATVTSFAVYLAEDDKGTSKSQLGGSELVFGSNVAVIPDDTQRG